MQQVRSDERKIANRSKKNKKGKRSKNLWTILGIIALLIISSLVGIYVHHYNIVKAHENSIYPGVKIEGIDMSNKSKAEAMSEVESKYQTKMLDKNIMVKADGKDFNFKFSDLDVQYNINETVNKAFKYGKNNSSIMETYKIINEGKEVNFTLDNAYNQKKLDEYVKMIKSKIDKKPKDAELKRVSSGFDISESKSGQAVDGKKLTEDIKTVINDKKPEDATVVAKIDEIKPKVLKSQLQKVNSLLSSFTTSFATSSEERSTNIRLATRQIDGLTIMPGGSFSFNDIVGERTAARGYKVAHVIINAKLDSGLGGGICQVSTTLYNAILRAGILPTERTHHTIPSTYVPIGMDATVDYGNIDYKFKNTLLYPIYIEGSTAGKQITFNIYTNSSLKDKSYEIVNNDTPVNVNGKTGHKVKVYRITYENGKQVSKILVNSDYYKALK